MIRLCLLCIILLTKPLRAMTKDIGALSILGAEFLYDMHNLSEPMDLIVVVDDFYGDEWEKLLTDFMEKADQHQAKINLTLQLPKSVFKIDNDFLSGVKSLRLLVINSSYLKYTNNNFLCECSSIEHIELPESLTLIGVGFMKNCSLLKHLTVPHNVESIGYGFLMNCENVAYVRLPRKLKFIAREFLNYCQGLKSVVIPQSVQGIGPSFLLGCYCLESVVLLCRLTSIPDKFINHCASLQCINIPKSVAYIGCDFLWGCRVLPKIVLPKGLKKIKSGFMYECGALQICIFPACLEYIGCGALNKCHNLSYVVLPTNSIINDFFCEGSSCQDMPLEIEMPLVDSHKWGEESNRSIPVAYKQANNFECPTTSQVDYNGETLTDPVYQLLCTGIHINFTVPPHSVLKITSYEAPPV
jgi:hypothetical protein